MEKSDEGMVGIRVNPGEEGADDEDPEVKAKKQIENLGEGDDEVGQDEQFSTSLKNHDGEPIPWIAAWLPPLPF